MKKLFLIFLLFAARLSLAQTTVTGTIVDANANPYANGTVVAVSIVNTGQVSTSTSPAPLNSVGFFSISLPPATYTFTLCGIPVNLGPQVKPPPDQVCFTTNPIAISGSTYDISAIANPSAQLLGPNAGVFAGGLCTRSGNTITCAGPFYVTGPFGVGTSFPTVCGAASDCIGFFEGTMPCTPTSLQNCVRATSAGWNCTVNGSVEFPCLSNGLPVINVKWYGAIGNGTADDTAAIQAAINACPQLSGSKGCIIFFPAGIYLTSSSLTNGPSPYTYHGVRLIGDGTVGRAGGATIIETSGAYYAYIMGNASTANAAGFQAENLEFLDSTGNGLGAFDVIALTDGEFHNIDCENYYVGVCITYDGGNGVAQFFHNNNIYTWHTKTRIQTVRRVASMFIYGGEGNCQNSGSTDVLPNSIDLDLGYSRQVSGAGTITTTATGDAFTVNTFTSGLGSLTQDYVNVPITINSAQYTIATVTSGTTGTLTTSAGNQSTVAWSISGQGGSGETVITSQDQNCQIGRALFNYGSTHLTADKASEQTILYRPAGSFGVIIAGDTPALANDVILHNTEITAAGTGIKIGPNTQNTKVDGVFGDGTNGVDVVADQTALGSTRIDATYRSSGWTVNLATISRSGNVVTVTTTPNLGNNAGNLCILPGTLVTVYGVTGGTTSFDGNFATTSVSCNDTTDVATLTWAQTGANESGTINTTQCVGNTGGSCIRALSSVLSTSTGLGVIELTGSQIVTNTVCQPMNSPPESVYPTTTLLGTVNLNCDGSFLDVIYGNAGYGVLHLSDGPLVPYAGNSSQYYQPQPTVTNSEVSCGTPVNASVVPNVCESSDDKGTVFSDAINGTTYCLPALPDPGFPPNFTHELIFAPGSGNAFWAVVPPGQASPYGSITCPGSSGTTLNNSTAVVLIPSGQGMKLKSLGTGWFSDQGTNTYVPPVPGSPVFLASDVTGITGITPAAATYMFTLPAPLTPNTDHGFECTGTTVQSTAGAGIGIAIGTVTTGASMEAHATVATSATTTGYGSSGNVSTTTETAIYTGSTGTATTQLPFTILGSIFVGSTAPTNVLIGFFTVNALDAVTVKANSFCWWLN